MLFSISFTSQIAKPPEIDFEQSMLLIFDSRNANKFHTALVISDNVGKLPKSNQKYDKIPANIQGDF